MNEEKDVIFEDYLNEEKGVANTLKKPKTWLNIFIILVVIAMVWLFYKTVIKAGISSAEIKKAVTLTEHDTCWIEKEKSLYEVKIVPQIAFKIKNTGTRPLSYASFEAVFEFSDDGVVHSDGMATVFKDKPLNPGEESELITIHAFFGYSAKSFDSFLNNKTDWRPMRAKLFIRIGGSAPVRIGEYYPIKQTIRGYAGKAANANLLQQQKESFEKFGKAMQITQFDSIWRDRLKYSKKTDKVIIVPSFSFKIKNVGNQPIENIFFKGEFIFQDNNDKLSEAVVDGWQDPLAPGDSSDEITITSDLGYQSESKAAFIHNPDTWRAVNIKIFAAKKGMAYVLLATYPIRRVIEGVEVVNTPQ